MMNDDERLPDEVLADRRRGLGRAETSSLTRADSGRSVSDDESSEDDEAEPSTRSRWSFLTEMVVLFVVALTIALLIKTFVVQPFFIPSASMEDTLLVGDKVLVNKLVYHLRPIKRGDIVVFNGAGSWNQPTAAAPPNHNLLARLYDDTAGKLVTSIEGMFGAPPGQTDYIKRVIGVPGDRVICCNASGQITVNGVPLSEKSYLAPGAQPSQYHFNRVVPLGRLWVMGDNREYSADSRLHDCGYPDPQVTCAPYDRDGTIPASQVIGRAFMIVWPPSRFRILPIPATFDQPKLSQAARPPATMKRTILASPGGLPVRPSAPLLPLAWGVGAAIPLTLLERRLRLRVSARRRARGSIRGRSGPRRG
jgi:signal peptidase I